MCVVIALGLFGGWFWKTWTVWWFDAGEARSRQAAAAARLGVPVEKAVDLGEVQLAHACVRRPAQDLRGERRGDALLEAGHAIGRLSAEGG